MQAGFQPEMGPGTGQALIVTGWDSTQFLEQVTNSVETTG